MLGVMMLRPRTFCRTFSQSTQGNERSPLFACPKKKAVLDSMIRVDQAGEFGAQQIYMGQLAALSSSRPELRPILEKMKEQEEVHLDKFNSMIRDYRVRPTALTPIWRVAGFALG
eukprot:TRINITY_DN569_c0_g1_i1.p1 TRINITY_DN569_c0_g1~~TRINITY_DN569_c0_g1_i1.p1  ORF type:complete len:126 (-),score=26.79 TRINITY_DN569_c0_g1_i1:455-799(-)